MEGGARHGHPSTQRSSHSRSQPSLHRGGDDGIMNLSSIEVFDPFYETWKYAKGRLTQGRSYAGVAVIEKPAETIAP